MKSCDFLSRDIKLYKGTRLAAGGVEYCIEGRIVTLDEGVLRMPENPSGALFGAL